MSEITPMKSICSGGASGSGPGSTLGLITGRMRISIPRPGIEMIAEFRPMLLLPTWEQTIERRRGSADCGAIIGSADRQTAQLSDGLSLAMRCRPATGGQRKRPRGYVFIQFDPGPVDRGHHRICAGLQIQIFLGNKIRPLCTRGGHFRRRRNAGSRRADRKPRADFERLEAEQRRREDTRIEAGEAIRVPLLCVVVHSGQDAERPRRTSSPRYERTARRAKSILRSPKW
jgi:hypothetical protein